MGGWALPCCISPTGYVVPQSSDNVVPYNGGNHTDDGSMLMLPSVGLIADHDILDFPVATPHAQQLQLSMLANRTKSDLGRYWLVVKNVMKMHSMPHMLHIERLRLRIGVRMTNSMDIDPSVPILTDAREGSTGRYATACKSGTCIDKRRPQSHSTHGNGGGIGGCVD